MKKYKLLNAKGLLFTLGAATAVIAPVATLVACGGSSSNDDDIAKDLHKVAQESIKGLDNEIMFKELAGWSLNTNDIFYSVFNTKKNGIIDVDIWNDNKFEYGFGLHADQGDISSMVDTTINGEGAKPQVYTDGSENAVKSIKLTKKDIIDKKVSFEAISDEIKNYISINPGRYLSKVVSNKIDMADSKGDYTTGEYTIYLFKEKAITDSVLKNAIDIFKDNTKFGIDLDLIKKMGGTYSMGQKHPFTAATYDSYNFLEQKVTQKGIYNDRANENNMKSWTSFGPIATPDQATKDALKDIKVTAYPVVNKQSGNFEVVVSVYHKDVSTQLTSFNTFTVAAPEITHFGTTKYNVSDLKNGLLNRMNFQYLYSFLHSAMSHKDSLDDVPTIKPHIIDIAALLPLMAQVKDELSDDGFILAIENYAKTAFPYLDFDTLTLALNALGDGKFEALQDLGAKTYSIFYFVENFYTVVKSFLSTTEGKPFLDKMTPITSAEDIYQHQKDIEDAGKYFANPANKSKIDSMQSSHPNWNHVQVWKEILRVEFYNAHKVLIDQLGLASATIDKMKEGIEWNTYLDAHKAAVATLGITFVNSISLDKEVTKINIEWQELITSNKKEIDDAAQKLGFTLQADIDAHKSEIIAEARKSLAMDISPIVKVRLAAIFNGVNKTATSAYDGTDAGLTSLQNSGANFKFTLPAAGAWGGAIYDEFAKHSVKFAFQKSDAGSHFNNSHSIQVMSFDATTITLRVYGSWTDINGIKKDFSGIGVIKRA